MKLIKIYRSDRQNKKYAADFEHDNGDIETVHFGDDRYLDFTNHGDRNKRKLYRLRHKKEMYQAPNTPGQLSLSLLWGNSMNINENINKFKENFNV